MASSDQSWMGECRGLTPEELRAFLSRPLIARLGTVTEDGHPYVTPLFFYFDGKDIYLRVRARSEFMRHILRDPRIALSVAEDTPPYTRVQFLGRAEIVYGPGPVVGEWLEIAKKNVVSYMGERGLDYFLPSAVRPRYILKVIPEHVRAWNGVEWHKRYLSVDPA